MAIRLYLFVLFCFDRNTFFFLVCMSHDSCLMKHMWVPIPNIKQCKPHVLQQPTQQRSAPDISFTIDANKQQRQLIAELENKNRYGVLDALAFLTQGAFIGKLELCFKLARFFTLKECLRAHRKPVMLASEKLVVRFQILRSFMRKDMHI